MFVKQRVTMIQEGMAVFGLGDMGVDGGNFLLSHLAHVHGLVNLVLGTPLGHINPIRIGGRREGSREAKIFQVHLVLIA